MVDIVHEIHNKKSWEEYISQGQEAREMKDGGSWALGDLAQGITKDYGENSIGKFAYAIGVERKTLMNYRTISGRFSLGVRKRYQKLSFSHFSCCGALQEPTAWLEQADDNEWSVETMRKEIRKAYEGTLTPKLEEKPEVYRCPTCHLWRLKNMSAMDICKGHYVLKEGKTVYE